MIKLPPDPNAMHTHTSQSNVGLAGPQSPAEGIESAPLEPVLNGTSSGQIPISVGSPTPSSALPITIPVNTQDGEDEKQEAAYKNAKLSPKMRRLTDLAIVSDLVIGVPNDVIAKNMRVDLLYVQRVRGEWLKACKLQDAFDYKRELKVLAIDAVREGLQSKSDPVKKMAGAVRVLQGIGEFKPEVVNVAVLQTIENVPAELRSRYITSSREDELARREPPAIPAEIISSEVKTNGDEQQP